MEHVRPARDEDERRILELLALARAATGSQRGGQLLLDAGPWPTGAPSTSDANLASVLGSLERAGVVLVGEFDGVVVGITAARLLDTLGRIELCFVEPGARGVGIGAALLDAATEWLVARGATGIDAVALPGDRDAKQLYETAGFKARALVLHRPTPPPDAAVGSDGEAAAGS